MKSMVGVDMWEKTGYIPPLPPHFGKKKRGRPTRARRRGQDEEPSSRRGRRKKKATETLPRQKFKVKCSFCGEESHNERRCKWKKFVEEYPVDEELYVEPGNIPPVIQESKAGEENLLMDEDIAQAGEEMTQADDIPPFTQESQADEGGILPRTEHTDVEHNPLPNVVENGEQENRAVGSHFIAANPFKPPTPFGQTQSSSSYFPPRNGPNIRVPDPMSFHPSENIYPDRGSGPVAPVPVVKIGGFNGSMAQGSKNKNKKKFGN